MTQHGSCLVESGPLALCILALACTSEVSTTMASGGADGGQAGRGGGGGGGSGEGGRGGAGGQAGSGGKAGIEAGQAGGDSGGGADSAVVDSAKADGGGAVGERPPGDVSITDGDPIPAGPCTSLVCEDFETGVLDKAVWGTFLSDQGKNSVIVQDQMAFSGKWAMKSHTQGSPHAFMYHKKLPASLSIHVFGRMRIYVTPTQPTNSHGILGFAGDTMVFPFGDRLLEFGANPNWVALAHHDKGFTQGEKLVLNRWLCVEFEINDQPNAINVWVDGKQQIALKNVGSGILGKFATIGLGQRSVGGPSPIDVYYDDIALDTKRIGGCP